MLKIAVMTNTCIRTSYTHFISLTQHILTHFMIHQAITVFVKLLSDRIYAHIVCHFSQKVCALSAACKTDNIYYTIEILLSLSFYGHL